MCESTIKFVIKKSLIKFDTGSSRVELTMKVFESKENFKIMFYDMSIAD